MVRIDQRRTPSPEGQAHNIPGMHPCYYLHCRRGSKRRMFAGRVGGAPTRSAGLDGSAQARDWAPDAALRPSECASSDSGRVSLSGSPLRLGCADAAPDRVGPRRTPSGRGAPVGAWRRRRPSEAGFDTHYLDTPDSSITEGTSTSRPAEPSATHLRIEAKWKAADVSAQRTRIVWTPAPAG